MPQVNERVYRIQAPYSGNAVHLYLVRGEKLALVDSGASDSPQTAVGPALREQLELLQPPQQVGAQQ